MFTDTLQKTVRAFWPVLLVWVFKFSSLDKSRVALIVGTVVVLISIIAYLKYRNFTFYIDEENDEFVLKDGILNKSRTTIPLEKIQQVNINQNLIQKFIGVHALEVDSAGSSKKEVTIKAITHELALLLKERLLSSENKNFEADAEKVTEKEEEKDFVEISFLSLVKTGITSNYARSFGLLFAFVMTIYQNVDEYIGTMGYNENPIDEYIHPRMLLRFITFIIVAIIFLTLLVNLSRTILKYFGYKIAKKKDSLLLSYGLLNTRSTIIKPERVQIAGVRRNFFQKKMNIQDVKVQQASNMGNNSAKEQQKMAIEIPGCNNSERDAILAFLLGEIPERGQELRPSIRKLIIQIVKALIIPVAIFLLLAITVFPEIYDAIIFLPVYILFVGVMVFFAYYNSKLFVSDDFIIKQSGAWDIDNDFLAPHKIQAVSVKQYFWQKKPDIGKVTLYTAGGSLSFGVANYTRIKELVNYWLYQVETTDKNWM
ncbi:hypothetical protein GCM10007424_02980 [Flavobacterium suaedae]|uniref:YdbS-like PH domain-containing protein n=2 Tax=Flavobacterium suaedae TaxID=1767027 RepID=A0ABQ1JH42_9FLAO|nr:hypothetical protein GCM10007424_02980 [Flavobacterium suaedae]